MVVSYKVAKKALEDIVAKGTNDPEFAKQFLYSTGIYTLKGMLTKEYGGY